MSFLIRLGMSNKAFKYSGKSAFSIKQNRVKKIIILTEKYGGSGADKGRFKGKRDFNKNQNFMSVQRTCSM